MSGSIHTSAHHRFTAISNRLLRLEYSPDGVFGNDPTLSVSRRPDPQGAFRESRPGGALVLETGEVRIEFQEEAKPFDADNLSVFFGLQGKESVWRPGMKDKGNLYGAKRTVDSHHGNLLWNGKRMVSAGNEPGFCSRDGWVWVDDSHTPLLRERAGVPGGRWPEPRREGIQDGYLFCHGHDYLGALRDAARLFGPQPLVPRWALGYWWSRWWAYTDMELEALVREFHDQDLPLDVLVLDMEWHTRGWGGYEWERDLFPDHHAFLGRMREQGLKIACNLHPSEGVKKEQRQFSAMAEAVGLPETVAKVPFDCTDPDYISAMFELCLHPHEDAGVDVWWLDWQQGAKSGMPGLDPLPWLNHLHWRDQEERRPEKRPLNFSRYGGPGAGRSPMGFSGDIESSWRSLKYLLRLSAESANSLFGYWSHDTGGFFCSPWKGKTTGELYLRWVQATVYQPIFRTHCAREPGGDRRFRLWGEPFGTLMAAALKDRYRKVPYIYTECRRMFDGPVSLCHPLYHRYPEAEEAYRFPQQYGFGSQLLVAPVTDTVGADGLAPVAFWLPEGDWIDTATGERLTGGCHRRRYALEETPVFARPGTLIPGQGPVNRLEAGGYADLEVTVYPGGDGRYRLYEDDGISTAYRDGASAELPLSSTSTATTLRVDIGPLEGDFTGIRLRRPLTLRVPHSLPPEEVTVDGQALVPARWSWEGERLETVIRLPDVDHNRALWLEIRWPVNRAPAVAAGLLGALHRCQLAFDLLRGACHDLLRPAGRLALTGRRIAAHPDTSREECDLLRREIDRLAAACAPARKQVKLDTKRGPAEREALVRAPKLLRAAARLLPTV